MSSSVKEYLEKSKTLVDTHLRHFFERTPVSPRLQEAMEYSLMAGGKRIRPALAFAACEAVGGQCEDIVPVAAALEMIHTYSLIHDDLPAMDNDDLRRGRPTNHKVFGEALAILAGDGLLTEAFTVLADPEWKIPTDRKIDVVGIIAEGAGAHGMVAGQWLDLESENKDFTEEVLEKIHRHKTGKLLRASALAGGRAAGASAQQLEQLDHYGKAIGLAFQIADDILDVTATTEELGKDSNSDIKKKKATYPSLIGIEASREKANRLLKDAVESLESFGDRGENLENLAHLIVERKS